MPMTFDDVNAFATSLPGVEVGASWGHKTWTVNGRGFAWQRPFSKADLERFGDEAPPAGDILAVRVESLDAKDALLAMGLRGFFTIPHFNGYAAVLIALREASTKDVKATLRHGLLAMAAAPPKKPKKPRAKSKPRARSQ